MKKTYLVTAYHQPMHLARLVGALQSDGVSFFIHVDKNVDIGPFEEAVGHQQNVNFVNHRHRIRWMGFSQVASILELMKAAVTAEFDYCTLLSGSDYPVKSNEYILSFFERSESEYLAFWRLQDRPSWLHKIQHYFFIDAIPIKSSKDAVFPQIYWRYFFRLRRFMPKRSYLKNMVPYGGSDWWSMSRQCVELILKFVSDHPEYVRFYRYTHCPSEMFFHSIILNSPLADRVQNYSRYFEWAARTAEKDKIKETAAMLPEDSFNFRYIDWSGEKTRERETPAVLDERDFEILKRTPDLFARKFEENRSKWLLDAIDRELRN